MHPRRPDLPFSVWSLAKLADFLVAEGVVDDISHEGLRTLLREEGVTFHRLRPGSPPKTRDIRRRRPASSTCMRSPAARWSPGRATCRWWSAWTNSGGWASSPGGSPR